MRPESYHAVTQAATNIIDPLIPRREVHLVGGASGSGKTRLLLEMILALEHQIRFIGWPVHPARWVYLSLERSSESILRTVKSADLAGQLDRRRFISLSRHEAVSSAEKIFRLPIIPRDSEVFFIEPLMALAPLCRRGRFNPNDYLEVRDFLVTLEGLCHKLNITIIGTHHATKSRQRDMIFNPRERLLGSVAWSAFSQTVMLLESTDPTDISCVTRNLDVALRDGAGLKRRLRFNPDGRLLPPYCSNDPEDFECGSPRQNVSVGPQALGGFLDSLPAGEEFDTSRFLRFAKRHTVPRRTAYRWLEQKCNSGEIEKRTRGTYCKAKSS